MNMTIANYVCIDGGNTYCGDDHEGNVYVAKVDLSAGDRFKHASWVMASETQRAQYWAARKRAADFNSSESYCAHTGESVFYCTCGWH
jgi:hypothetical protein